MSDSKRSPSCCKIFHKQLQSKDSVSKLLLWGKADITNSV